MAKYSLNHSNIIQTKKRMGKTSARFWQKILDHATLFFFFLRVLGQGGNNKQYKKTLNLNIMIQY